MAGSCVWFWYRREQYLECFAGKWRWFWNRMEQFIHNIVANGCTASGTGGNSTYIALICGCFWYSKEHCIRYIVSTCGWLWCRKVYYLCTVYCRYLRLVLEQERTLHTVYYSELQMDVLLLFQEGTGHVSNAGSCSYLLAQERTLHIL